MKSTKKEPRLRKSGVLCLLLFLLSLPSFLFGQAVTPTGNAISLGGQVVDPSGALVPGATVTLTRGATVLTAISASDGRYQFRNISAGTYQLAVEAVGFAPLTMPGLVLSATRQLNLPLKIAADQEQVTVTTQAAGLSMNSDENANSTVLKGSDIDALSDDPDQLLVELQALAGPTAGPDGGQIYIDGFTGGQLPPKSAILEVHINQNPFSAENDRIGYGRIDIVTKPGSAKFGGHARFSYLNSALNTAIPLVTEQPSYQYYSFSADVAGPLGKKASGFFAGQYWERQNKAVVNAVNPADPSTNIDLAFPAPYSTSQAFPRVDFQLGRHVLTVQDVILRTNRTGRGVGQLSLPEQAFTGYDFANILQVRDSILISKSLINEVAFRWWRDSSHRTPAFLTPAVTVTGAFTTGGNYTGQASDLENNLELHDYVTLTHGAQYMRFGGLIRSYNDAYTSHANINGSYQFQSIAQYQAGKPSLYSAAVIHNPLTKLLAVDAALFFQDEWRWRPNVNISAGLRVEGQNRIHNPVDWAPRFALMWGVHNDGKTPPKTVIRVGFGIFYNRFRYNYLLNTILNNGVTQQTYNVQNPNFYDPVTPIPASVLMNAGSSTLTVNTLDPHFHASQSLQTGAGVDQMIGKLTTFTLSYLYTQGTHQYLTNNITAPAFDTATYTVTGPPPTSYNYQYQSGGIFRQHQIIFTTRERYKRLSLQTTYTYSKADSDTQGTTYFPSVAQNPRFDYGRSTTGLTSQFQAIGSWTAPHGFIFNSSLFAQSGTPYNITLGSDLTENNQFNARPTYGVCGAADVVRTAFGCLDTNPAGKGETIIPYNLGTGPTNLVMNLNFVKNIALGREGKAPAVSNVAPAGGAPRNPPAAAPRRYGINIQAGATNIFNIVNRAAPNGVLSSPLFGQSQALAGGPYTLSSPGNKTVYITTTFTF